MKNLGDKTYSPSTQSLGTYAEPTLLEMGRFVKLAATYVFADKDREGVCRHNAEVALSSSLLSAEPHFPHCRALLMWGSTTLPRSGCC